MGCSQLSHGCALAVQGPERLVETGPVDLARKAVQMV